jgi:3-oxo-5-alpha-steroid 4-dehydrogenase 1
MTWSLAGLSFAVWTIANLVPRAIAGHKWYNEKFEDYPKDRKAILPYLL